MNSVDLGVYFIKVERISDWEVNFMSKKIIALLFAVLMAATVASAATLVKSTDTTVTSKGGKVVKTVSRKHFKRMTHKGTVKSTTIKSTIVAPAKK